MTLLEKYKGFEIHMDLETDGPIYYVHRPDEAEDYGSRMTIDRARSLIDDLVEKKDSILDTIGFGDSVTIRTAHGSEVRGRATIRGPHGWVLNTGGAHGTPRVATATNIVNVKRRKH